MPLVARGHQFASFLKRVTRLVLNCTRKRQIHPSTGANPIPADCWQVVHAFCSDTLSTTLALRLVSRATVQPLMHTCRLPCVYRMLRWTDVSRRCMSHAERVETLAFVAGADADMIRLCHLMRWCVQQRFFVAEWLAAWADPSSSLPTPPTELILAVAVTSAVRSGKASTLRILGSAPFNANWRHCDIVDLRIAASLGHVGVMDALTRSPYARVETAISSFPCLCQPKQSFGIFTPPGDCSHGQL